VVIVPQLAAVDYETILTGGISAMSEIHILVSSQTKAEALSIPRQVKKVTVDGVRLWSLLLPSRISRSEPPKEKRPLQVVASLILSRPLARCPLLALAKWRPKPKMSDHWDRPEVVSAKSRRDQCTLLKLGLLRGALEIAA
jgi:hypothetical protein